MTRKGKIARLPHPIREEINRRLQNGGEGNDIAQWLNTLPEVVALMAAEFDGQPINENNVSNWKQGGYRDWEAALPSVDAIQSVKILDLPPPEEKPSATETPTHGA